MHKHMRFLYTYQSRAHKIKILKQIAARLQTYRTVVTRKVLLTLTCTVLFSITNV